MAKCKTRHVYWETGKELTPDKGKRLIVFLYTNGKKDKIVHCDRVKVFGMDDIDTHL